MNKIEENTYFLQTLSLPPYSPPGLRTLKILGDPEVTANIYTANYATFSIRTRKITAQICGNFLVTQYMEKLVVGISIKIRKGYLHKYRSLKIYIYKVVLILWLQWYCLIFNIWKTPLSCFLSKKHHYLVFFRRSSKWQTLFSSFYFS